ncbi:nucleotidyltransferase domain-containing protein [Brevibacillus ruminantium]|uniref:Nucleotidyltransferase domain-containing protein n=1 Tax=Brevibacillus ruminantium TaxID=2950604 RepID=A0ABY4WBV7_9BACL|nr:nucleotidyltransferase domain-containing protein [Brevibacillus ruminantium]USG64389.1 nucleotidyltransferase domain-containing protein [Brevibacillus ruminantium]
MKESIQKELMRMEREQNIKVLLAVESGSRAWGFPSQDSDYDVRFVYICHPEWYLSIDDKRDVIEVPINDLLDMSGWDIRKTLKLFRKSNPPLLEWLISDTVYYSAYGFKDDMVKLRDRVFSPKASLHHYLSMAKGNFRDYLQGEEVRIKKYFYVLRPLLACMWIKKYNTSPPLLFQDLIFDLIVEPDLKREIEELLTRKMSGEELKMEKRNDILHRFIEEQFDDITQYARSCTSLRTDPTAELDELYRKYLKIVWG